MRKMTVRLVTDYVVAHSNGVAVPSKNDIVVQIFRALQAGAGSVVHMVPHVYLDDVVDTLIDRIVRGGLSTRVQLILPSGSVHCLSLLGAVRSGSLLDDLDASSI